MEHNYINHTPFMNDDDHDPTRIIHYYLSLP